jgi:hypothetical protein
MIAGLPSQPKFKSCACFDSPRVCWGVSWTRRFEVMRCFVPQIESKTSDILVKSFICGCRKLFGNRAG